VPNILRPRAAWLKVGVGRSNFHENYTFKKGGGECVPNTNVPRLRPVVLGPRARGFLDDEVDALIEGLRRQRDGGAS
jgi:predicted DNA-binding transcriptional regulator AlpA